MIMCLHWLMHYRAALGGALVSFFVQDVLPKLPNSDFLLFLLVFIQK